MQKLNVNDKNELSGQKIMKIEQNQMLNPNLSWLSLQAYILSLTLISLKN